MSFKIFPAIDLRGGNCVRLLQGDYSRETIYRTTPVEQATLFQEAGASWVHIVDLDAALSGDPVNHLIIKEIAEVLDIPIQVGGGIRTQKDARSMFDAGGADVEDAFRWAKNQDNLGEPLLNNKAARESIADWYCEKSGLKNTKLRTMSALSRGDTPGPEASITKIVSAGKLQNIGNFGIDSLDMAGMLKADDADIKSFQNAWLGAPGMRIAGGTDEILRNIIAERVLGLPQDPRADKGVAFKDIPSGNS